MLQKTRIALLAFAGVVTIMTQEVAATPLDAFATLEHKDGRGIRTQVMTGQEAPAAAATLKARDNPKPPELHWLNKSDHRLIPFYVNAIDKNTRHNLAPASDADVILFEAQFKKLKEVFQNSRAPFRFFNNGVFAKYRPSYDYGGHPCPSVDSPVEIETRANRHVGNCGALNMYIVDRLTTGKPCQLISSHVTDPLKCHLSAKNTKQDGITITRNAMKYPKNSAEFITAAAKWLGLDFENPLLQERCKDGDLFEPDSPMALPLHKECPPPHRCSQPSTVKPGEVKVDPMDSYVDDIPNQCKRRFRRTEVDRMAWNFMALREDLFHRT